MFIHEASNATTGEMDQLVQFMRRACNSHERLVMALKDAFFQFEHNGDESDSDGAVLNEIQAALTEVGAL